jgi:hypothetical protein
VRFDARRFPVDLVEPPRHARFWGAVLIVVGSCGYPAGLAVALTPIGLDAGWPVRLPAMVVGGLVFGLSYAAVRIGRRLRVVPGDWDELARDPRPPIVYLRPFDVDGAEQVTAWTGHVRMRLFRRMIETTYEQRVARAVARVGPLVAIADPSDELLEIGATRYRAAEWEWQHRVAEITERACAIILHAGVSDGLAWEIEHVVALGSPERVIVALPLDAQPGRPAKEDRYFEFVRKFWELFPRGLPDEVGNSTFLYFDADWTPRQFGHRGASPPPAGEPSLEHRALVLARLDSEFKVRLFPFWARAGGGCFGLIVTALAVGTAIYAALN